jgi:3-hydroxybutyryl-CoA dehydratase
MSEKKYYLWDELEVGQHFEPFDYELEPETIRQYVMAVQEQTEIYSDPESARSLGLRDVAAPPTMAAVYTIRAFRQVPAPPGGIHAKQQFHFYQPALAGDWLTTLVEIIDKYIKREKKYVVMTGRTVNQNGDLIVTAKMTRIWAK